MNYIDTLKKAAFIGAGAVAVVGGGDIVGALLAPIALPAVGFGAAGVTAGSCRVSVRFGSECWSYWSSSCHRS